MRPMSKKQTKNLPRLPDSQKALLIALANGFLVGLVLLTFRIQKHVGWSTFYIFASVVGVTAIYVVIVFVRSLARAILAFFQHLWGLIVNLGIALLEAAESDPPDTALGHGRAATSQKDGHPTTPTANSGTPNGHTLSRTHSGSTDVSSKTSEKPIPIIPWVAVNFAAVGWLVYSTGGAVTSPYSQIPLMMVVFGQLLTDFKPDALALNEIERGRDLFILPWHGVRIFRTTFILGALFYIGVSVAEVLWPTHVGPTPDLTVALVTALNVFLATLVNLAARRGRVQVTASVLSTPSSDHNNTETTRPTTLPATHTEDNQ